MHQYLKDENDENSIVWKLSDVLDMINHTTITETINLEIPSMVTLIRIDAEIVTDDLVQNVFGAI